MEKIKINDMFFISSHTLCSMIIKSSNEDIYPTIDSYNVVNIFGDGGIFEKEILYCVKYIGNGRVIEKESNREFHIECDQVEDFKWIKPSCNKETYSYNGESFDRIRKPIGPERFRLALLETIALMDICPLFISNRGINTEDFCIPLDDNSIKRYVSVSIEERKFLMDTFEKYAKIYYANNLRALTNSTPNRKLFEDMQAFKSEAEYFQNSKNRGSIRI